MKVGIVVPYSFSFWGGVVEHAEQQAHALADFGVETRLPIGHDPPGRLSRALHPTAGRFEPPPGHVLPLGRSVIAPANRSLANIVLSPSAVARLRRTLVRERFDLLRLHEPLTPALGVAALASADCPIVATFHAAGPSRWRRFAMQLWGFLLDRIDVRIAVSEAAADTARGYAGGDYLLIPNGVRVPETASLDGRGPQVLYVGRHEPRKGLPVLPRAWSGVRRRTGTRLRVVGADPLAVRYLLGRELGATQIRRTATIASWHDLAMPDRRHPTASASELERAAAFRAALRHFLARTDEVASAAGLTPGRYDLLLAIKSSDGQTSTVTELSRQLSLRQTAVTELVKRAEEAGLIERAASPSDGRVTILSLSGEGERRLMKAFLGLREERNQLAEAMGAVAASFRAVVRGQKQTPRVDGARPRAGRSSAGRPSYVGGHGDAGTGYQQVSPAARTGRRSAPE